jgi:hypothetical protein
MTIHWEWIIIIFLLQKATPPSKTVQIFFHSQHNVINNPKWVKPPCTEYTFCEPWLCNFLVEAREWIYSELLNSISCATDSLVIGDNDDLSDQKYFCHFFPCPLLISDYMATDQQSKAIKDGRRLWPLASSKKLLLARTDTHALSWLKISTPINQLGQPPEPELPWRCVSTDRLTF